METIEITDLLGFSEEQITYAVSFFKQMEEIELIEDLEERLTKLSLLEQKVIDPDLTAYAHACWRKHADTRCMQLVKVAWIQKDLHTIETLYDQMKLSHQYHELLPKVEKYYRHAFKELLREAPQEKLWGVWKRKPRVELVSEAMRGALKKTILERNGDL